MSKNISKVIWYVKLDIKINNDSVIILKTRYVLKCKNPVKLEVNVSLQKCKKLT